MNLREQFSTNKYAAGRFMQLPTHNKIQVEYVWIDGSIQNVRSKTKTVDFIPKKVDELPIWNFDGSSTDQASGADSDVFIKPVAMFNDPFRLGNHKIVMCEAFDNKMQPHITNNRNHCRQTMETAKNEAIEKIFNLIF